MDVVNEIDIYARWANLLGDAKYSVDGIFFDEIPGTYDWQSHDYLKRAAEEVNFQNGLGQQVIGMQIVFSIPYQNPSDVKRSRSTKARLISPLLVHNPGQIPYPTWNYLDLANLTVVFEETYSNWLTASTFSSLKNLSSTVGYPKSAFALMLHSVPDIPAELVSWTADQMSQMADWNFVSSVKMPDAWHSFSSLFTPFMTAYGGVNR
jgi:hypothetical protein